MVANDKLEIPLTPYTRVRNYFDIFVFIPVVVEYKYKVASGALEQTNKFDQLHPPEIKKLRQELLRKSLRLAEREKITELDKELDKLISQQGIDNFCSAKDLAVSSYDNNENPYNWMDYEELYDLCLAKSRIKERIKQCASANKILEVWCKVIEELDISTERYEKADISSSDLPKKIEAINEELENSTLVLKESDNKKGWPRIVSHPNIRGGKPTFEGTRWAVYEIASMVENEGIEFMIDEFEGLTRPMIAAALEFAKERPNAHQ